MQRRRRRTRRRLKMRCDLLGCITMWSAACLWRTSPRQGSLTTPPQTGGFSTRGTRWKWHGFCCEWWSWCRTARRRSSRFRRCWGPWRLAGTQSTVGFTICKIFSGSLCWTLPSSPRGSCAGQHTEAIYACMLAFARTKEQVYLDWLVKVHDYSYKTFVDKEHGEWFGYCDRNGTLARSCKGGNYKGCFHVPRGLLFSIQAARQLQ
mmetsp:Transcript_40250/g.105700  ORF Transcript_40250/g.105700 Transcript_40250/m.105700 type:complete len:206 (+) Transcript_40250:547-1164(+)